MGTQAKRECEPTDWDPGQESRKNARASAKASGPWEPPAWMGPRGLVQMWVTELLTAPCPQQREKQPTKGTSQPMKRCHLGKQGPLATQGRSPVYSEGGFPGGTVGKESACQCRRSKRWGCNLWVRKIPLEEEIATHSSILSWENSMGSPWGHQESDMIE